MLRWRRDYWFSTTRVSEPAHNHHLICRILMWKPSLSDLAWRRISKLSLVLSSPTGIVWILVWLTLGRVCCLGYRNISQYGDIIDYQGTLMTKYLRSQTNWIISNVARKRRIATLYNVNALHCSVWGRSANVIQTALVMMIDVFDGPVATLHRSIAIKIFFYQFRSNPDRDITDNQLGITYILISIYLSINDGWGGDHGGKLCWSVLSSLSKQ